MAYAFSSIKRAMQGPTADADKQDIFGGQATTTNTVEEQQQLGGNAGVKTSTEGEIGGSSAGSPEGQSEAPATVEQGQSAGRAALRASLGKTKSPKALDDVSAAITARDQELTKEADTYTSAAKPKFNYAVGNEDIEKAIGGDVETQGKVKGLLGKATIDPVDSFKPETDVQVQDAIKLQSDPGLQELMARGQGPTYSRGESAFDLRALKRTPGFTNTLGAIAASQEALNQRKRDLGGTTTKAVEEYGKGQLDAAKKGATDYLVGQETALAESNAAQAKEAQDKLDNLRRQGLSATAGDVKAVLRDLQAKYGEIDPRVVRFIEQAAGVNLKGESVYNLASAKIDPGQFQKFRETPYAADDFYDEGEASRFNSIMGLLGKGGPQKVAGAQDAGAYSFDRDAYADAVSQGAYGMRGEQDTKNLSEIDEIRRLAQERADAADAGWLGLNPGDEATRLAAEARGSGGSFFDPNLAQYYEKYFPKGETGIDPASFYTGDTRDLQWSDVLSASDAAKMNALAEDAAIDDRYSAGSAALGSQASFNRDAYLNALRAKIDEAIKRDATPVAPTDAPPDDGQPTPTPSGFDPHDPQINPPSPAWPFPMVPKKPEDIPGVKALPGIGKKVVGVSGDVRTGAPFIPAMGGGFIGTSAFPSISQAMQGGTGGIPVPGGYVGQQAKNIKKKLGF